MALKVLTLSCVYPNPVEPGLGLFVQRRLEAAAGEHEIRVIAPVPLIDYSKPDGHRFHPGAIPAVLHDGGIEVTHLRWVYPPFGGVLNAGFLFAQVLRPMVRMRRTFEFDLIDAHFGYPDGIAAALAARMFACPFTITLRGCETMHAESLCRQHAMAWALQNASRVIAVSRRLREFALHSGVSPERIAVIPNGVDSSVFYPRDRTAARESFGIAHDAPAIASAGYLIERKGHHRVIRALDSLAKRGTSAELLIAGGPGREGRYEDSLRALVAESGLAPRVRFLGNLEPGRLAELMSAADVVCLASSREGWPNVVHEAMACGTPVVATDIGAVPDMIPSAEYGLVVPSGDQDALASALRQALETSWNRKLIAAHAQSRSWRNVATEVCAQWEEAARARVPAGQDCHVW